ncbi:kinesin-like protein KIF13A [Cyprinus carpio]|uniref:Kinesin-like protein KIF13A n=1 Tax=Cyprinus carpio TaxID=7962 RepID=A0A9R0BBL9_CYPCA|nr:kinesin-like protein KIF13A [Cyprinus carpio]
MHIHAHRTCVCFWGQSAEDSGLDDAGWLRESCSPRGGGSHTQAECNAVSSGFISTALSARAVTMKEALSAKGRHMQRSLSTPNIQHSSCCTPDGTGCEDEDVKTHCDSHMDVTEASVHEASLNSPLAKDTPVKNKENQGSVPESPTFFNSSPFKVLSPQPPKFLKSLLPLKEENKVKRSLESQPLLGQESMC